MAGFWTHRDLVTDAFDIDDLLDAHEILAVKAENQWRAEEAAKEGSQVG